MIKSGMLCAAVLCWLGTAGSARAATSEGLCRPLAPGPTASGQGAAAAPLEACPGDLLPRVCLEQARPTADAAELEVTELRTGAMTAGQPLPPQGTVRLYMDKQQQQLLRAQPSAQPLAVVVVLMTAKPRFEETELKNALRPFVGKIYARPDSQLGLIGYSDNKNGIAPRLPVQLVHPLLAAEKRSEIDRAIEELRWKESTPEFLFHYALKHAVRLLSQPRYAAYAKHVVMYSNGDEKDQRGKARLLQDLAAEAQANQVLLHRVARLTIPTEPGEFDCEVQRLLDAAAGIRVTPKRPEDLTRAFDQVAEVLLSAQTSQFTLTRPAEVADDELRKHRFCFAATSSQDCLTAGAELGGLRFEAEIPWPAKKGSMGWTISLGFVAGMLGLLFFVSRLRPGLLPALGRLFSSGQSAPNLPPGLRPDSGDGAVPLPDKFMLWLYDVRLREQKIISKTPFSIGNDVDCDWVLSDLSPPTDILTLRYDFHTGRIWLEGASAHGVQLLDKAEFAVGNNRIKFFLTNLG